MSPFSIWVTERILEDRRAPTAPKKKKAAVAHTDIDRWLKSVDGLAKDLKSLQDAKKKASDKIAQIGKKYTPEPAPEQDKDKDKEKEKNVEPGRKRSEKPRLDTDRRVLSAVTDKSSPRGDKPAVADRKVPGKPAPKRKVRVPQPEVVDDDDDME